MTRTGTAFLALTLLTFGLAQADAPAPLWSPHIDFEAKPGSKRTLGEADFFLPLAQDARTLVFGNLRARFDNQSSYEGNFGAGVRRMYDSGWNLGAYGYWDHRRSGNGNFFDQATLGAEALGRDWEFRANGYLPVGTRAYTLGSDSVAAVSGASLQVTTTTREERALKGFDLEAGWRLPIFDSEGARQLRLYAGGYRFADAGVKVEGPRLRAELALHELPWLGKGAALFLGAETQHDSARGSQNFLSVRLRIPLGTQAAQARSLTAQERRMTAPVMRDVDVVTQSRVASTLVETAITTGGQTITTADGATTPNLQAALNAAGPNSTVILSGTFDLGNGNVTLQAGQTVMGAGSMTVRTPSGRVATFAASQGATIASTIQLNTVPAVTMASDSTLTGMTIVRNPTFGSEHGVDVVNVSGVTLTNNTISSTATNAGVFGVFIDGSSNIRVVGNTITGTRTGGTGIGLYMRDSSVFVADNTLRGVGTTSYAAFLAATAGHTLTLQPGSSGNILANGSCNNSGGGGTVSGSFAYTASGISGTCP